jgi:hypothetical protein
MNETYVTLDQAEEYFSGRPNSDDWDTITDAERTKYLIAATECIERLNFLGTKTVDTQTLKFPRDGDIENPEWLIKATCECAIVLADGMNMEQEIENLPALNQNYAGVSTGYTPDFVPEHTRAGIPSAVAWNYIKPHLVNPRNITLRRV